MFRYAATALIPLAAICCAAEAPQAEAALPDTHQKFIPVLLDFLAQTEQCLAGCTDAASTAAVMPRLNELAARAHQLAAHQASLPEPTVQDYMAAHPHVGEFNKLWKAISGHIERMEQAALMTPELHSLLQLAPEAPESPSPNRK